MGSINGMKIAGDSKAAMSYLKVDYDGEGDSIKVAASIDGRW